MENQFKGFAYANTNKPTVLYGASVEEILRRLNSYNAARVADFQFKICNIGQLDVQTSKYVDYHKFDVATGRDISNTYLEIPALKKSEFKKVISDLKAAGARYNPSVKKWYITPDQVDQDIQKFQDICNQFNSEQEAIETGKNEIFDATESQTRQDLQIEGIDIQYAIKMENQKIVTISSSEIGLNPADVSVGELIEKLGEKATEQIRKDPEAAVQGSEYSISVSKNNEDNRCTIYFNDGREPLDLRGDAFGIHFPTMDAQMISDFVEDYMSRLEKPELNLLKEYKVGDQIDCYIPLKTNKLYNPEQPIYVENVEHIIGTIQNVEKYRPNVMSLEHENHAEAYEQMEYVIRDQQGNEYHINANDIYAPEQAQVLLRAAEDELFPVQYDLLADRNLSAAQMEEIRFGFKDGLTIEQVALYAQPDMKPSEMDICRIGLQNGLGYVEIRNLLRDTKELSWIDSRNKLNEAIKNHKQVIVEESEYSNAETGKLYGHVKDGYRPPEGEVKESGYADFYGMTVPLEDGKKVISQKMVDFELPAMGIEKPDFNNCIFRSVDFPYPLAGMNFAGSKFYNCRFIDLDMGINFNGASFYNVYMKDAILKDADFRKTYFENVRMISSELNGVDFSGAEMKNTYFDNCGMEENDFNMVKMDFVRFRDCGIAEGQKNLDTVTYTISGAQPEVIEKMKDEMMWQLSGSEISYERKEELSQLWNNEGNDPETREWRDYLTSVESELVADWDAKNQEKLREIIEWASSLAKQTTGKQSVVNLLNEKKTMVSSGEKAAPSHDDRYKNMDSYIAK